MSIKPYARRPKVRPVGLYRGDHRVICESGQALRLREVPEDMLVYADRELIRSRFLKGQGEVVRWNLGWTRWEVQGRKVILLSGYPGDSYETAEGLFRWKDWLADYGAAPGTIGAASYSLLRATIMRPLYTSGGHLPPIREVIGGRQEGVAPGTYGAFSSYDMSAAYTRTLGGLCYGGRWIEAPGEVEATHPTFYRAKVRVPHDLTWAPLPRRRRKPIVSALERILTQREYPHGRVAGAWSAEEVDAARAVGAKVTVTRSWFLPATERPFEPWLQAVEDGRRMPGFAGLLAKMTGNALWGRFIILGDRTRLSYAGGRMSISDDPIPGRSLAAPDLAELVCSSVRARLYCDFIVPNETRVASVHTDGGLLFGTQPALLQPGWRHRFSAERLIYIGPQTYAYQLPGERGLRYVLSGVPPKDAAGVFESLSQEVLHYPKLPPTEAVRAIRELLEGVGA